MGCAPGDVPSVRAISNQGQVVGYVKVDGIYHGFIYSNNKVIDLGSYGFTFGVHLMDINDTGQIVGLVANGTDTYSGTPIFFQNAQQSSPTMLAGIGYLNSINNLGRAAGVNTAGPFTYENGTITYLQGSTVIKPRINNAGQIAGQFVSDSVRAGIYQNGAVTAIGTGSGAYSWATAINEQGLVVGYTSNTTTADDSSTHAFIYQNGAITELPALKSSYVSFSEAYDINNLGQVVGYSNGNAFIYQNGLLTDLNSVAYQTSSQPGFLSLVSAKAINDQGQIAGWGVYSDGTFHAFFLTPYTAPSAPVVQPSDITVTPGATVAFNVSNLQAGISYQWKKNGTAIAGATSSSLILQNTTQGGSFTCTASVPAFPSVTSAASTLTVANASDVGRLTSLSVRTIAGTGDQTLIVGFATNGSSGKSVLVRATGPALAAFGVGGTLPDPKLTLFAGSTRIDSNDNWGGKPEIIAANTATKAFPLDPSSKDAALLASLGAGLYSTQVSGNPNSDGSGATGVSLVEVYDTANGPASATAPRLASVSARTQVGVGDNVLIAGFVIGGATAKTVLVRATGPALAVFGVGGTLADPQLSLYAGITLVASNDNWGGSSQLTAIGNSVQAFELKDPNSKDAVLLVTLPPGLYSAQVRGAGDTSGVALVEVYEVP
jgi:probable HAF family extracellular repeat protein